MKAASEYNNFELNQPMHSKQQPVPGKDPSELSLDKESFKNSFHRGNYTPPQQRSREFESYDHSLQDTSETPETVDANLDLRNFELRSLPVNRKLSLQGHDRKEQQEQIETHTRAPFFPTPIERPQRETLSRETEPENFQNSQRDTKNELQTQQQRKNRVEAPTRDPFFPPPAEKPHLEKSDSDKTEIQLSVPFPQKQPKQPEPEPTSDYAWLEEIPEYDGSLFTDHIDARPQQQRQPGETTRPERKNTPAENKITRNDSDDQRPAKVESEKPAVAPESDRSSNPLIARFQFWMKTVPKYLAAQQAKTVMKAKEQGKEKPSFIDNLKGQRFMRLGDVAHGLCSGFGIELLELGMGAALIPTVGVTGAFWITTGAFLAGNWVLQGSRGLKETFKQGCACPIHEDEAPENTGSTAPKNPLRKLGLALHDRCREINHFVRQKIPGTPEALEQKVLNKPKSLTEKIIDTVDSAWYAAPYVFHKACDSVFMRLGYEHHGTQGALALPFFASVFIHVPLSITQRLYLEATKWEDEQKEASAKSQRETRYKDLAKKHDIF